MSPEQVRGKELDVRADLFSFGVVLYEMVTGALPFRGESAGTILNSILERPPVPPVRLNPEVPSKLEEIINKALEKDRSLRYQSPSQGKRISQIRSRPFWPPPLGMIFYLARNFGEAMDERRERESSRSGRVGSRFSVSKHNKMAAAPEAR
jgi:serine/threonine protein kinase